MPWLVRGDDVLASAEVAVTRKVRRRGLIGRDQVPIDVAFCDRYGFVLHISRMRPGRISRYVFHAYFAIEATGGSFDRWEIGLGDIVEVRG